MFVIPMLGFSSRFFKAGYNVPKYRLPLNRGSTIFEEVLSSFREYFETDHFRIICRKDFMDKNFITHKLKKLGISDFEVIEFEQNTRGQAESVMLALKDTDMKEELYIFNIDTILLNFEKMDKSGSCDGYLEVFEGEGEHWSFVQPKSGTLSEVERVTEKERISNLCSNGLYYFKTVDMYQELINEELKQVSIDMEIYVAPLYNRLISNNANVKYKIVKADAHQFCGTPDEYEKLMAES